MTQPALSPERRKSLRRYLHFFSQTLRHRGFSRDHADNTRRQAVPYVRYLRLKHRDGSVGDAAGYRKWLLQRLPLLGDPLGALSDALGLVLPGLRARHPGLEDKLRRIGGTARVLELRTLDGTDLFAALLKAFAAEVSEGAPERPGRACRAVIFLDTYERLWTGQEGPLGPQGALADDWVRDLYRYLCHYKRVLLVMAGHDPLRWADPRVDPTWATLDADDLHRHLDQHLIAGLTAWDTQRFLSSCGVGHPPENGPPTPLQAAIIRCSSDADPETTGSLPFYVGLCANIVLQERGPEGQGAEPNRRIDQSLSRFVTTHLVGLLSRW